MKTPIKRRMRQEIAKGAPLVRKELVQRGFRANTLSEMATRGELLRVSRGIYISKAGTGSEFMDYELAAKVAEKGVFTLVSALRIHSLTDENPFRMTMAIPQKRHAPKTVLPIDFVYMRQNLLNMDVMEMVPGVSPIRVFTIERTIAECFKARYKIGIEIAITALREAIRSNRVDYAKLADVLERCRMRRIVDPYLASLI